jgi:hypothetical protein
MIVATNILQRKKYLEMEDIPDEIRKERPELTLLKNKILDEREKIYGKNN